MSDRKKISPVRISLFILIALAAALLFASGLYTDFLWFDQLGFAKVFTTQITAQAIAFVVAFVVSGMAVYFSLFAALRSRPIYARNFVEGDPLAAFRQLAEQLRKTAQIVLPLIVAVIAGLASGAQWQLGATYLNHTYTGTKDAQFGMDVGFYLFDLPFYNFVVGFASTIALLSLVLAVVTHAVFGNIRFNGRSSTVSKSARIQLAITAAVFLLIQAATLWLDQYATMTSDAGLFTGATYADVNAAIPSFQILALIALVVTILFLVTAVIGRWRLALVGTGLMVISSIILAGVFPWVVQTFQVVPNERTLEAEFIKRNIEATRIAYGLDGIDDVDYQAKTTAEAGALRADADTTANIRLIDPTLVSSSFRQLQQVQQYYNFANHLDVDRYTINGKTQDTVLAVRELNQSGLGDSQSWYNNVIVYTHGYGVVAAY